jgi:hypothetical protein
MLRDTNDFLKGDFKLSLKPENFGVKAEMVVCTEKSAMDHDFLLKGAAEVVKNIFVLWQTEEIANYILCLCHFTFC